MERERAHTQAENKCTLQRIPYDLGKVRLGTARPFTISRMNISRGK